MRRNDFNLASILFNYRTTINKSFTVKYNGSEYRGRIDNRDDWLVYFFGNSDNNRIQFARKIGEFLKFKTGRPFTCYDVGASRGAFSLSLTNLIDHVVAFEQSGGRYSHLLDNIAASDAKNIMAFNITLSDENEVFDQCRSMIKKFREPAKDHTATSSDLPRAKVKRGDTVIEESGIPSPDLIRINAGNDYRSVLRGFEATLDSSHPIILIEQPMSCGHRFADETDLRSALYEDAMLFSLSGSSYRAEYWLDHFDPKALWIVCYPPKIGRMIDQELNKLVSLRLNSF